MLGEFTFASLLIYDNLQVVIALLGKSDATVSVAASLAALLFAFVLLFAALVRRPTATAVPKEPDHVIRRDAERPPATDGRRCATCTGTTATCAPSTG